MRNLGFISNILLAIIISSVLAFYLGTRYQETKLQPIIEQQKAEVTSQKVPRKENLDDRCGKLPIEAYPKGQEGWSDLTGPFWSPDCRWAISSLSVVGRGLPPRMDAEKIVENIPVGIFLYKDSNKSLIKVYKNGTLDEWTDRENFTFTADDKNYNYNVLDKELTSED